MTKFQEAVILYEKEFKKLGVKYDKNLLIEIAKSCGPSIFKADSAKVSSSDKSELEKVKRNFLIKKLGLEDSPKLDQGIADVVAVMGSRNRNKYRVMFYYLLVRKFRKSSLYKPSTKAAKKKNNSLSQFYNKIAKEDNGLLKRLAK